ncbi:MAG: hypothetical protein GY943_33840 [Chloroflexi bacterium]|nr:hypothetical protein [Chloroflexota bacterium]
MKHILFIGDSITEGKNGYSFVRLLQQDFPDYQFTNLGVGGDTLFGIMNRLFDALAQRFDYDCIVLEAGFNDLILPQMRQMNGIYRQLAKLIPMRGSVPAENTAVFSHTLHTTLTKLKTLYDGPIIITTISCLGEDSTSQLNDKRRELNAEIRQAAASFDIQLADVEPRFDAVLQNRPTNNLFLGNIFSMLWLDPLYSRKRTGVTTLSQRRGTHLTIDGVHLNYEGATIFREVVCAKLSQVLHR